MQKTSLQHNQYEPNKKVYWKNYVKISQILSFISFFPHFPFDFHFDFQCISLVRRKLAIPYGHIEALAKQIFSPETG